MTIQELINEINFYAETAEPQSEENLEVLYTHYAKMFLREVGKIPDFVIVDNKGTVKLKCDL